MHVMTPLWKPCLHTGMTDKSFIWFIGVLNPTAYKFWVYDRIKIASIQIYNKLNFPETKFDLICFKLFFTLILFWLALMITVYVLSFGISL